MCRLLSSCPFPQNPFCHGQLESLDARGRASCVVGLPPLILRGRLVVVSCRAGIGFTLKLCACLKFGFTPLSYRGMRALAVLAFAVACPRAAALIVYYNVFSKNVATAVEIVYEQLEAAPPGVAARARQRRLRRGDHAGRRLRRLLNTLHGPPAPARRSVTHAVDATWT